jgi:hypothetical protein
VVVVDVLASFFDAVVGTIAFITGIAKEGYDEDNDGAAEGAVAVAAGEGAPKVNPVKAPPPPPPPDEDDANFTVENALLLAGAAAGFAATAGDLQEKEKDKNVRKNTNI